MLRSYARVVVGEGEGGYTSAYDFHIQPTRQELYGVSTRLLPRFLLLVFSYLQHDGLYMGEPENKAGQSGSQLEMQLVTHLLFLFFIWWVCNDCLIVGDGVPPAYLP